MGGALQAAADRDKLGGQAVRQSLEAQENDRDDDAGDQTVLEAVTARRSVLSCSQVSR